MPFQYEERVSPRGRPYVRVLVFGDVDFADAEDFLRRFSKGGPYHRKHTLSVVAPGTTYSPEARKHVVQLGDESGPHATVTTSALVRAAINLMTRFSGNLDKFRMFTAEPEAVAWLEDLEV
jgi:hypothetical protein